jgi:hypothetical protein
VILWWSLGVYDQFMVVMMDRLKELIVRVLRLSNELESERAISFLRVTSAILFLR